MSNVAIMLKTYFAQKKKARPGFSLRTFAKTLGVSPAFLSDVLSGKKPLPLNRLKEITEILDMDLMAVSQLKRLIASETLELCGIDASEILSTNFTAQYQPVAKSDFSILNPWYNIAIMDFVTCDQFKKDSLWIASKLGITKFQVEYSLGQLLQHGFLKETDSDYQKVTEKIRLSISHSHPDIRNFHIQMMERAQKELLTNTSQEAFQRREISGVTIAANPEQIAKAKARLTEAIHEVAEILSQGSCTEVFQINTQMFSLIKNKQSS